MIKQVFCFFMACCLLGLQAFASDFSDRDLYVLDFNFVDQGNRDSKVDEVSNKIEENHAFAIKYRGKTQFILQGKKEDIITTVNSVLANESYHIRELSEYVYQVSIDDSPVMNLEVSDLFDVLEKTDFKYKNLASLVLGDDCVNFNNARACLNKWAASFWDQYPLAVSADLKELEKFVSGEKPLDEFYFSLKGNLVYQNTQYHPKPRLHLDDDYSIAYLSKKLTEDDNKFKEGFYAVYEGLKNERKRRDLPIMISSFNFDVANRDRATGIIYQYLINENRNILAYWKISKRRTYKNKLRHDTHFFVEVDKSDPISLEDRNILKFEKRYRYKDVHINQWPILMTVLVSEIEITTSKGKKASIWIPTFLEKGGFWILREASFKYLSLAEKLTEGFPDRSSFFESLFKKIDHKNSFIRGNFKSLLSGGAVKSLKINLRVLGTTNGRSDWGRPLYMKDYFKDLSLRNERGEWREQYNLLEVLGKESVDDFLKKMPMETMK